MNNFLRKIKALISRFTGRKARRNISRSYDFHNEGFHGDRFLLDLVDGLIKDCDLFIETGANVGSTLAYVAGRHSSIQCKSCEPDTRAFREAERNTDGLANVALYNLTSLEFFDVIKRDHSDIFGESVLFWLDSHGYGFKWPLKEEISFITDNFKMAYILIDDFKVPGMDCFGWDEYKGQICSFEFIRDSIRKGLDYSLYYPAYTIKTSRHHPLRGWGLIRFGHSRELNIPSGLKDKIKKAI